MARYIGPVCKLCRREGMKLYLKGERCYSEKCAYTRRPYPPGQHGQGRIKLSEYAVRLREKQKVRRVYGVLEKQFRNYFVEASRHSGVTGEYLLRSLEQRMDNVVYRLGFAPSRAAARQMVTHGHFAVNGVPTNIPSYSLKIGDKVEVRQSHRERELFKVVKETLTSHQAPDWLSLDAANFAGTVIAMPRRDQMPLDFNEQLVVEYYSR
jgi:small subunit ribosomal protein S4